jgi:hypothetical protein
MRIPTRALVFAGILVSAVAVFGAPASSPAAPAVQGVTGETAAQFYLRWRSAAVNAKSMADITPFWTAETVDEFNMEPESAKADTLPMIKRFFAEQTDVRVVKETPTPNGVTLALEGKDAGQKPVAATVDVVKEKGAWKMTAAVERWAPKGI